MIEQRIQQQLRPPTELSELESAIGPPYFYDGTEDALGLGEVWHEASWSELNEEQRRDFVHVRDVARAFAEALVAPCSTSESTTSR